MVQSRTRGGGHGGNSGKGGTASSWKPSANSANLNVNDLGFFHSIQQLKEDVEMSCPEDLVETTTEAFEVYPRETLERVWQSLFAVLGEVLGSKGDNSYKLPHLGKENLGRTGKLPVNGRVDEEKYRVGKAF
ncbi:unnamed protein product, partial [Discosporangium mesarthrocarpum]